MREGERETEEERERGAEGGWKREEGKEIENRKI